MSAGPASPTLADAAAVADLATYLGRARRADPDGAARMVAHGQVLAVYVSPVHGAGGPTVLGLRTLPLAGEQQPPGLDVTVPLGALLDRCARIAAEPSQGGGPVELPVPPNAAVGVAWAGMAPPRTGWETVGLLDPDALRSAARSGIEEIAVGVPAAAGGHAVGRLRALVWGRPLAPDLDGVPAGVAFAAQALGFVPDGEPAALYRSGAWVRVTTGRGHVLARPPALL